MKAYKFKIKISSKKLRGDVEGEAEAGNILEAIEVITRGVADDMSVPLKDVRVIMIRER